MADEDRPFYLRTYLYKCFYFCPAFYDAYKNHSNWKNIYARIHNNEAIFLCLDCIEKMRNYISEDKPYFFYETKKNFNWVLYTYRRIYSASENWKIDLK